MLNNMNYTYDAFICHASEDKDKFVRELAERLQKRGFNIWYDEFTLKIGDSLLKKISEGLLQSKYGIVIFSKAFFEKQWTERELAGLSALEKPGEKKILPIYLGLDVEDIKHKYPTLTDLYAADASKGIEFVVNELISVIKQENDTSAIKEDDSNQRAYLYPTAFFEDRVAEAFPGIRGIHSIENKEEIIERLNTVLQEPLEFKGFYPPLNLYTMRGLFNIGRYRRLDKKRILIHYSELVPKRLIVYRPELYWQYFIYLECEKDIPTGLYNTDAKDEEYAINGNGELVSRQEYNDGSMYRNGKIIPLVNPELRIRYLAPTNYFIASRASPMNIVQFDRHRKALLQDILKRNITIEDFVSVFQHLPKHDSDI